MSTSQAAYITAYMDLARPPDSNRPSLVDRTSLAERLPVSDEGPRDWSHRAEFGVESGRELPR